jgi:hypothetical protein
MWGLFRHYWVVVKLVLNIVATALACAPTRHAVLALLILITATVLAIYKPRGLTRHGWRKQQDRRRATAGDEHCGRLLCTNLGSRTR